MGAFHIFLIVVFVISCIVLFGTKIWRKVTGFDPEKEENAPKKTVDDEEEIRLITLPNGKQMEICIFGTENIGEKKYILAMVFDRMDCDPEKDYVLFDDDLYLVFEYREPNTYLLVRDEKIFETVHSHWEKQMRYDD